MIFPERPTCHDADWQAKRFKDRWEWRQAFIRSDLYEPAEGGEDWWRKSGEEKVFLPWRECAYCGSVHPQDLLEMLGQPKSADPCPACDPGPEPEIRMSADWAREHVLWTGRLNSHHTCRTTLGGADWKYGWPHKFYVYGIRNPDPNRERVVGHTGGGGLPSGVVTRLVSAKEPFLSAKFYNVHLTDDGFDDEARAALFAAVEEHGGIKFSIDDEGRLKYRAPHYDYQR